MDRGPAHLFTSKKIKAVLSTATAFILAKPHNLGFVKIRVTIPFFSFSKETAISAFYLFFKTLASNILKC